MGEGISICLKTRAVFSHISDSLLLVGVFLLFLGRLSKSTCHSSVIDVPKKFNLCTSHFLSASLSFCKYVVINVSIVEIKLTVLLLSQEVRFKKIRIFLCQPDPMCCPIKAQTVFMSEAPPPYPGVDPNLAYPPPSAPMNPHGKLPLHFKSFMCVSSR